MTADTAPAESVSILTITTKRRSVLGVESLMNLDELKQGLISVCSQEHEWIPVESRLPPMFQNVIAIGILSKDTNRKIHEARRWTGYSGPDADHDELGGKWEWLTPSDRHVKEVTHWFPKPAMPE